MHKSISVMTAATNRTRTYLKISYEQCVGLMFLCFLECPLDASFHAKTSIHPVNLTHMKNRTRISFLLKYKTSAYPPSNRGFDLSLPNEGRVCYRCTSTSYHSSQVNGSQTNELKLHSQVLGTFW